MSMFHPVMTPELRALRHDTTQSIEAVYIGVSIITTLVVGLRLWARRLSQVHFGWDDTFMVAAAVFMFANLAVGVVAAKSGLGIMPTQLTLNDIVTIRKCVFAYEIFYVINIALVKFSIMIMYCRIFRLRSFRVVAWILSIVTVLWVIISVFFFIFQCSSVDRAWNPLMVRGHCLDLRGIFIANAVINIVTDLAILVMPLYHVWRLQLRLVQRITLIIIFMLGCFVIASSIYRFITVLRLDRKTNTSNLKEPLVWSFIEISTAIVSGCLPWMRPLLTGFLNKVGMNPTSRPASRAASRSRSGFVGCGGTIGSWKPRPRPRLEDVLHSDNSSEFADLDDKWSGSPERKNSQSDVLTLHSIMVITTLEQSVDQRQIGGNKC